MSTHGTASDVVRGTFVELVGAVVRNLPRDLDTDVELGWANNGDALARALRSALVSNGTEAATTPTPTSTTHPTPSDIPADGVEFELTLEPTDALAMVKSDGYDPKGWQYTGPKVTKPETKRVKLIRLGHVRDLAEAQAKAREQGCELVIGQWREAFKKRFPTNDGNGPIGFGSDESAWVHPRGDANFPVLGGRGDGWLSVFFWSGFARVGRWRWLAASK